MNWNRIIPALTASCAQGAHRDPLPGMGEDGLTIMPLLERLRFRNIERIAMPGARPNTGAGFTAIK